MRSGHFMSLCLSNDSVRLDSTWFGMIVCVCLCVGKCVCVCVPAAYAYTVKLMWLGSEHHMESMFQDRFINVLDTFYAHFTICQLNIWLMMNCNK